MIRDWLDVLYFASQAGQILAVLAIIWLVLIAVRWMNEKMNGEKD